MILLAKVFHWTLDYTLGLDLDQVTLICRTLNESMEAAEKKGTGSASTGKRTRFTNVRKFVGPDKARFDSIMGRSRARRKQGARPHAQVHHIDSPGGGR